MLLKDKELDLIRIFMHIDDFCLYLEKYLQDQPEEKLLLGRFEGRMSISEILSIIVFYHHSGYKCFQYYFQRMVEPELQSYFPGLVTYKRFLTLIGKATPHLYLLAKHQCLATSQTGIMYVDAKKLPVCHNRRINNHKVFKGLASRGYSSTGWFFGLKLHLVINNLGQVANFCLTAGNIADNNSEVLRQLFTGLNGTCYGDKGYLTKIFEELLDGGVKLVTKIRKNMKNKLMDLQDKYRLFKRGVIESVFDIMMTVCDIEHTRHRSPKNGMAHMLAAIIGYGFLEKKPTVLVPKMLN